MQEAVIHLTTDNRRGQRLIFLMITSLVVLFLAELHMTKRNEAYLSFLKVRYKNRRLDSLYLTFHYVYLSFLCFVGLSGINSTFIWPSYALMMASSFLLLYPMWATDRLWSSYIYDSPAKKAVFRWLKKPEQVSRFLLAISFVLLGTGDMVLVWPLAVYPIYSLAQIKPLQARVEDSVSMKNQLR